MLVSSGKLTFHSCFAMVQVCSGVRAMHQMNPPMAHRDVKPHNVLIRSHLPPEPAVPRQRFLEQPKDSTAAPQQQQHVLAEAQPLRSPLPQGDSGSGRYQAVLMVGLSQLAYADAGTLSTNEVHPAVREGI